MRMVLCVILLVMAGSGWAQTDGAIYYADLDGVINPLSASYVSRAIEQAESNSANVLILQLDTPGGMETSMREIIKSILASKVPVVVYVAPSGARAASAGMFITISAHVAAMAPGTNIGAAHPVALGQNQDEVMSSKIVQDSAAFARSLAAMRNRNAVWAERAVKESISSTATEALNLRVIDIVAKDRQNLLAQINGRSVNTNAGEVVIRTLGARQVDIPMTFLEKLLHIITDPNIAYLLLSLGVIGIIAELYHPGTFIPGITGIIALLLAFVALGSLPFSWAGIALLLLAVVLLVAELFVQGFGVLGVGGVVAFVLGSMFLFAPITTVSPSLPSVRVDAGLIVLMTLTLVAFLVLIARKVLEARHYTVATGIEAMIGQHGKAVSRLDPMGLVVIGGEQWSAESAEGVIENGREVEIVAVSGVIVRVKETE